MKALKLSGLAFLVLGMLTSCVKETSQTSDSNQLAARGGQPNTNPGNNTAVNPTMTVTYNPNPGVQGQTVTVTGSLTPAAGETAPTCGKLQLMQYDNATSTWIAVGSQVTVTATVQSVSYDFVPTVVGTDVYQFKLHYIPAGCTGYGENKSDAFPLSVVPACIGLSLTGSVTSAVNNNDGTYTFQVTYTVGTCTLQFDKLKIQGGLTNFSTFISAVGGLSNTNGTMWVPGSSINNVIKWEENTPGTALPDGDRNYVITFKKAWNGSDPITLTGGWSVSATWAGTEVGRATFDPIVYP